MLVAQAAAAESALSTIAQAGILGAFCVVFLVGLVLQDRRNREDRVKSDERWVQLLDRYHALALDSINALTSQANATASQTRAIDATREAVVQAANADAQNAANMKQALELLARRSSTQSQQAVQATPRRDPRSE